MSNLKLWIQKLNRVGHGIISIMVIPHNERHILNLQLSKYALLFTSVVLLSVITASIVSFFLGLSESSFVSSRFNFSPLRLTSWGTHTLPLATYQWNSLKFHTRTISIQIGHTAISQLRQGLEKLDVRWMCKRALSPRTSADWSWSRSHARGWKCKLRSRARGKVSSTRHRKPANEPKKVRSLPGALIFVDFGILSPADRNDLNWLDKPRFNNIF